MPILVTTLSILALGGLAALIRRITHWHICPICVGTAATWLWILIRIWIGLLPVASYQLPAAILMGGSAVGIAYQLEKRLRPRRSALVWKMLFIPLGFALTFTILAPHTIPAILLGAALLIVTGSFVRINTTHKKDESPEIKSLEKKMEECC